MMPIRFTHPDRPLWPGVPKRDLLAYYQQVAPVLLRHCRGRLLTVVRSAGGEGSTFYQRHPLAGSPSWLGRIRLGGKEYLVLEREEDLLYHGQMGAIECHVTLAPARDLRHPDWAVFDLDPVGEGGKSRLVEGLARILEMLDLLQLPVFLKTSGRRGMHGFVPIRPEADARIVQAAMERLALALVRAYPALFTVERSVARRNAPLYVDYLQNGPGRTMVAVYSPRQGSLPRVSAPFLPEEAEPLLREGPTIHTLPQRLQRVGDLWQEARQGEVSLLSHVQHRLDRL